MRPKGQDRNKNSHHLLKKSPFLKSLHVTSFELYHTGSNGTINFSFASENENQIGKTKTKAKIKVKSKAKAKGKKNMEEEKAEKKLPEPLMNFHYYQTTRHEIPALGSRSPFYLKTLVKSQLQQHPAEEVLNKFLTYVKLFKITNFYEICALNLFSADFPKIIKEIPNPDAICALALQDTEEVLHRQLLNFPKLRLVYGDRNFISSLPNDNQFSDKIFKRFLGLNEFLDPITTANPYETRKDLLLSPTQEYEIFIRYYVTKFAKEVWSWNSPNALLALILEKSKFDFSSLLQTNSVKKYFVEFYSKICTPLFYAKLAGAM